MSENTIFVKKYSSCDDRFFVNEREIWRYAGHPQSAGEPEEALCDLLCEVKRELLDEFSYKVCYRRMDISWEGGMPLLPFYSGSKQLAKSLAGSREIIIFAATIGLGIDRQIARYQRLAPTKALLMQAYGAERIERLCDVFCEEIEHDAKEEGLSCTPRYSPGYGDLPLEAQKEFFKLLDCSRQIGVSLNDSLLMTPSKSVTAVFGIGKCESYSGHKCENCENTECEYRENV